MTAFKKILKILLLMMLTISYSLANAQENYSHPGIDYLIKANVEPVGVVFELIEWGDNTWQWAAPMIRDLKAQLQDKYPKIEIAIVSHGGEQFQLTRKKAKEQPRAISLLKNIVEDGTNLYVCGTHSSWKNIPETDYIDIVNVAVSGPAKINDYINLGYVPIQLYSKSKNR
jgi:intracellular sulfur oxidation DsrE/DsrF family protein